MIKTPKGTTNHWIPGIEIELKGNHFHRKEAKFLHLMI